MILRESYENWKKYFFAETPSFWHIFLCFDCFFTFLISTQFVVKIWIFCFLEWNWNFLLSFLIFISSFSWLKLSLHWNHTRLFTMKILRCQYVFHGLQIMFLRRASVLLKVFFAACIVRRGKYYLQHTMRSTKYIIRHSVHCVLHKILFKACTNMFCGAHCMLQIIFFATRNACCG